MLSDKDVANPTIKLIDFGLAHQFKQGEEYKSMCGTPQYIRKCQYCFGGTGMIDFTCSLKTANN